MQVFNSEFVQAIKNVLESNTSKYITREEVCVKLGVSKDYAGVISIMFDNGMFPEYETVRSRGIKRRELQAAA